MCDLYSWNWTFSSPRSSIIFWLNKVLTFEPLLAFRTHIWYYWPLSNLILVNLISGYKWILQSCSSRTKKSESEHRKWHGKEPLLCILLWHWKSWEKGSFFDVFCLIVCHIFWPICILMCSLKIAPKIIFKENPASRNWLTIFARRAAHLLIVCLDAHWRQTQGN